MKREFIIQGFLICAAFLISVVLTSGCVGPRVRTYSGDTLEKSEVAVIKGRYYYALLYYDCINIYSVDDSYQGATKVEVLYGRHELVIEHYVINLFGYPPECVRVAFNFEAGHEYKIKKLFNRLLIEEGIKIIDVTTGAIILTQPWSQCPQVEKK